MQTDIQEQVTSLFNQVTTDNLMQLSDLKGYQDEFYRLFGFNIPGIDYSASINPNRTIASIS